MKHSKAVPLRRHSFATFKRVARRATHTHDMAKIFVYNPTCEMAVQNNTVSYQPPARLKVFEQNMASIMMFLASEHDYIVAPRPDEALLRTWAKAGQPLPAFVSHQQATDLIAQGVELAPWGMSRQLLYSLQLKEQASAFGSHMQQLLSRLTSVELERQLAAMPLPAYAKPLFVPTVITHPNDLTAYIRNGRCAVKSLWSSSGRGVTLVRQPEHIEPAITWAQGRLRHDGAVVCEPFVERIAELTLLFAIEHIGGKAKYLGRNIFQSDTAGRFGHEYIGQAACATIDSLLPNGWHEEIGCAVAHAIDTLGWSKHYSGNIGVDAMIYNNGGTPHLRCCMEANLRTTMGHVNRKISQLFADGTQATWHIEQFASAEEWGNYVAEMEQRHPLVADSNGKIKEGFFRLTPVGEGYIYGAYGVAEGNAHTI